MQAGIFRKRRLWLGSLLALMILALAFPSTAQEDNYCRTEISQRLEVGDTLTGAITANVGVGFYCFDAERGDTVTVTVDATDDRLIPIIYITDPVFDINDFQPFATDAANRGGGTAEVTFEVDSSDTYLIVVVGDVNTLGTFEISLNAEGCSILSCGNDSPTQEPGEDATDVPPGEGNSGTDPNDIVPGETNFCRVDGTEYLEYGDSVSGELDDNIQVAWYCFEASEGDVVTLEAGTESGDVVVTLLLAQPFFDLTDATILDADQARNRSDSAEIEYVVPEDGDYLIWVQISDNGQEGEYYLDIDGEAGVVFDCSNEPLSTLTSQQWMIASDAQTADAEATEEAATDEETAAEPLLTINVTCDGMVALSPMGAPEVGYYNVNQDGELFFQFGNEIFTTVSLDETGWTIANSEGTEYHYIPVPDTNCSEESMATLINGRWSIEAQDGTASFSFACNGIFIFSSGQQTIASDYTYEDGTLTIIMDPANTLVFEDVVIEDNKLSATLDGNDIQFDNDLAD